MGAGEGRAAAGGGGGVGGGSREESIRAFPIAWILS